MLVVLTGTVRLTGSLRGEISHLRWQRRNAGGNQSTPSICFKKVLFFIYEIRKTYHAGANRFHTRIGGKINAVRSPYLLGQTSRFARDLNAVTSEN